MKNLLLLLLLDGVLGYYLQAVSYVVIIYACNCQKLTVAKFLLLTIPFGIAAYGVRQITVLSFGYHTILLIVSFVLVSVFILKFKTFPSVIGTLLTTLLILLCELIVIFVLSISVGDNVLHSDGSVEGNIRKSLYGVPVNILLTVVASALYYFRLHVLPKKARKEPLNDRSIGA